MAHKIGLVTGLLFLLVWGCSKPERLAPEPKIEQRQLGISFGKDLLGNIVYAIDLKFALTDGDGDMGLRDNDINEPFAGLRYNNFFCEFSRKKAGGNWVKLHDSLMQKFRIPYIEPDPAYQAVIADIDVKMTMYKSPEIDLGDSLKLEYWVLDRAFNESNHVLSGSIAVPKR